MKHTLFSRFRFTVGRTLIVSACAICAVISAGAAGSLVQSRLYRGPYPQLATAHSIVLVWRTVGQCKPVVRFGKEPGKLNLTVKRSDILEREWTDFSGVEGVVPDGTYQYEARLSGLEPLTRYYYAIYDGKRLLAGGDDQAFFRTYPKRGESAPLRFMALGDSHGQNYHYSFMMRRVKDMFAAEKRPADLFIHLGDLTSRGRDLEYHYLFNPRENLPWQVVPWTTAGNHDPFKFKVDPETGKFIEQGTYQDIFVLPTKGEAGGEPSGAEAFYSFDYGRVHFISLASFNVDRTPGSPMLEWLKKDVARIKAEGKTDWLIAFCHSPVRSGPGTDKYLDSIEMRTYVMPLLEEAGLDMILSGHFHVYERSMLVDGAYATPMRAENNVLNDGDGDPNGDGPYRKSAGLNPHEGTVSITAGIGGAAQAGNPGYLPLLKRRQQEAGFVLIDIDGDTLTGRKFNYKCELQDTFQIIKRGKVKPQRIAKPKPGIRQACRNKLQGVRHVVVPVLPKQEIKLDGTLDEGVWTNAACFKLYRDYRVIKMFAAPGALYVGVRFWTGHSKKPVLKERDGNLAFERSSIEFFVDPRHDGKDVYLFACTSGGIRVDAKNGDKSCDPEWELKVRNNLRNSERDAKPETWIAEMRIPWQTLGMNGPPDEDTLMGMNMTLWFGWWAEWFSSRGRYMKIRRPSEFAFVQFGPERAGVLIKPYETWRFLAGGEPGPDWTKAAFDDSKWKEKEAGFGYGGIDNSTFLDDMKGRYSTVYVRKAFDLKDAKSVKDLALIINYDDAFIAYLNGKEVVRVGVDKGAGINAKGIHVHEPSGPAYSWEKEFALIREGAVGGLSEGEPLAPEFFSLKKHVGLLKNGKNILAIETHNASRDSKAFTVDPYLVGRFQD